MLHQNTRHHSRRFRPDCSPFLSGCDGLESNDVYRHRLRTDICDLGKSTVDSQEDQIDMHFETDFMPTHTFAVFANGFPLKKEIVNDVSAVKFEGIPGIIDILVRLNSQGNIGDRKVVNSLTGRLRR